MYERLSTHPQPSNHTLNTQITRNTGGFSYVYLVKDISSDSNTSQQLNNTVHGDGHANATTAAPTKRTGSLGKERQGSLGKDAEKKDMVLKVTSILSRQQRDIAEKEAKLLSRLSHPSIIKMYDTCYRTVTTGGGKSSKDRPQHLILMELCEGGPALDVCTNMSAAGERFDLSTLIIAFGQICNAVSYLHAQRPPIVHRDLKPANFLVKNGAYKLCDFGSAVFGHVDLKTKEARNEAEEVIQKTTTQMFRAPEMVDLFMAKKLTQATDVWALGACLYSLAFLQNCFEEGSNLAILSNKYKIPDDNPYGDGLVELLDRMLTIDCKSRADMTEVILCLSAVYSGRPLPPRKERTKKDKEKDRDKKDRGKDKDGKDRSKKKKDDRAGTFRTDGQGNYGDDGGLDPAEALAKKTEAKKLNPNSAAARRRQAAVGASGPSSSLHSRAAFGDSAGTGMTAMAEDAFSSTENPFASAEIAESTSGGGDIVDDPLIFGSFEGNSEDADGAFGAGQNWSSIDPTGAAANGDGDAAAEEGESSRRARTPTRTALQRSRSRSIGRTSSKDDKPRRGATRGASLKKSDAAALAEAVKALEPEQRRPRSFSRGRHKKLSDRNSKEDSIDSIDFNPDDDDDDDQIAAAAAEITEDDAKEAGRRRPSAKPRRRREDEAVLPSLF
jgi:serine/threonine protein kinase